jgi:hypothetical protein
MQAAELQQKHGADMQAIEKQVKSLEQEKRASIAALEQIERQMTDALDNMHAQLEESTKQIDRWPGFALCVRWPEQRCVFEP